MTLLQVSALDELAPGSRTRVETPAVDVVVVRVGDDLYAIEDRCSHGDVPLSEGELDGCLLECWLHGSAFDVRTGEPTSLPAVKAVRTFPVVINDLDGTPTVLVEIG